jgi:hypothetical protein
MAQAREGNPGFHQHAMEDWQAASAFDFKRESSAGVSPDDV